MLDQLKYLNLCSQLISSCYLEMRFIVTKKVIHHTQNIALNQCNSASSWLNLKILVENVNIYFFVDPMFYFLECMHVSQLQNVRTTTGISNQKRLGIQV